MDEEQNQDEVLLRQIAEKLEKEERELNKVAMMVAIAMYKEFCNTGIKEQIDTAVRFARLALDYTADEDDEKAGLLSNLGVMLGKRYERTSKIEDLKEPISMARQAVDSTPSDHPDWAACLGNLGNMLGCRYKRTGAIEDLEEAISMARQAVDSTPSDHPDRAAYLNNLGNKLESRYECTQELNDLQNAANAFELAWQSHASIPFPRISAAGRVIKILYHLDEYNLSAQIAEQVIELLPIASPRFLDRGDKQYILSTYSGIAADEAAVLLKTQGIRTALQSLEKGRAVILGQLIDNWSDISALKDDHPELASQFEILRNEFNSPASLLDNKDNSNLVAQRRRSAATELDKCIHAIRQLSGHEHFMSALSLEQMQACAIDGTIIVVNISELRSDAIIVSSNSIKTLALPELSALEAKQWVAKNWQQPTKQERGSRNKDYCNYLRWLWKVCVKHVLDAIELAEPGKGLSRVWWVGSGLASSMPFHAAGDHYPGSHENAFSRVISSYTPSIKTLSYSRSRGPYTPKTHAKAFIASMPITPGLNPLPGTTLEQKSIINILANSISIEVAEQPSAEVVTQALKECSIAHFACHGQTNIPDPFRSGLIFARRDDTGNLIQDPLTVHDVAELNLRNSRLAYLSACSTAENKAVRLADEAIHVVSGLQVAGFPHVIGCLWPSLDRICEEVARGFYTSLTMQGILDLGSSAIAEALHKSVVKIAARDWKQPLNWAQFVHYGA
jgi:CHAT domain-containing protein